MHIQKQIPVSVVHQVLSDNTDVQFTCYGIAKILNLEFKIVEDEHCKKCYAAIANRFGICALSAQINQQLWQFLVNIGFQQKHETHYGFDFIDFYLKFSGRNRFNVTFEEKANRFRVQILQFILDADPDAFFTVNLNSDNP